MKTNLSRLRIIPLLFLGGCLATSQSFAQKNQDPTESQRERFFKSHQQWAWTEETWAKDDKVFSLLQSKVDQMGSQIGWPKTVAHFEKIKRKQPKEAASLFCYSLAIYRSTAHGNRQAQLQFPTLLNEFNTIPSPHSYRYTRIRYLMEVSQFARPQLKVVVRRLLKRDPSDVHVLYSTLNLWNVMKENERQESLDIAKKLIKIAPKRPISHAYSGWIHYQIWLVTKKPAEASAAIAGYQNYLNIAPKNDSFRQRAQEILATIKKQVNSD